MKTSSISGNIGGIRLNPSAAPSAIPVFHQIRDLLRRAFEGEMAARADKVEGSRIKLTKKDSGEGSHKGHHHFIEKALVAGVEGNKVRLSANADVAVTMEQEESAKSV